MSYRYYYHTTSKKAVLAHSHYSDPAYDAQGGAIIFGEDIEGLQWEYADRLRQWDYDKHDDCWRAAKDIVGNDRTALHRESYLRFYFDDPTIEIVCIKSGTRPFDGYPWYVYGFTKGD